MSLPILSILQVHRSHQEVHFSIETHLINILLEEKLSFRSHFVFEAELAIIEPFQRILHRFTLILIDDDLLDVFLSSNRHELVVVLFMVSNELLVICFFKTFFDFGRDFMFFSFVAHDQIIMHGVALVILRVFNVHIHRLI